MECYYGKGTLNTDKTSDDYIFVNNFGYHKNINQEFSIIRKDGRLDYQIIYIDKGYGHFLLDGEFVRIGSGNIILLRPGQKKSLCIFRRFSCRLLLDSFHRSRSFGPVEKTSA